MNLPNITQNYVRLINDAYRNIVIVHIFHLLLVKMGFFAL